MRAILNNDLIELNAIPEDQVSKFAEDQRTEYEDVWYNNPNGAQITPAAPDKPADCYTWSGSAWVIDLSEAKTDLKSNLSSYRWSITYDSVDGLIPVSYMDGFPIFQTLEARERLGNTTGAIKDKIDKEIIQPSDTYRFKNVDDTWTDVVVEDVLEWRAMLAETEQTFYDKEEVVQELIDALSTEEEIDAFNVVEELDNLVKPILSANLTNYSYPIKYHNEDA